ncbi:hypothetical protein KFE25_000451 [Diacronema lutheri]|uniref:Uncharacterized protein n=1 Tax=Diacronema lutheri TaxID=2081491 RepID=A0A8J6CEQ1_DIALT|nr:hypothetical protein KFE25_000451 [Diacronema lutheri]
MSALSAPAAPERLADTEHAAFLAQAASLRIELLADKAARESLGAACREIQEALALHLHARHLGDELSAREHLRGAAQACAAQLQLVEPQSELRVFTCAQAMQALACAQTFESFLTTGTLGAKPVPSADWTARAPQLAPRADGPPAAAPASAVSATEPRARFLDTEWLHGMISAAHEIGRYAQRRGAAGDAASVAAAAAAVGALQEGLLAFNLRNGPLRQAFDSLKYVVRRCADTLYELALFDDDAAALARAAQGASRPAVSVLVDMAALDAARAAYEDEDEARELAIKRARDVQKLAKNAIFALHRADAPRAAEQLRQATELSASILRDIARAHTSLRGAPFVRAMLEELAEARLFEAWLGGARLLARDAPAFGGVRLEPSEYLGGLGDLIGEVARVAVAKATVRDAPTVLSARGCALAVLELALSLGTAWPRRVEGKLPALRTAITKLDQLIYEHALRERSGRRTQQVEWQPEGGTKEAESEPIE